MTLRSETYPRKLGSNMRTFGRMGKSNTLSSAINGKVY